MEKLSNDDIRRADLSDWRKLAQALHARFLAPDDRTALAFLGEATAQETPDGTATLQVQWLGGVLDLSLCTRVEGRWVTPADIERARRISDLARRHRLQSDPSSVTQLELALDTADQDRVAPFWSALLTGEAHHVLFDTVFDPSDRVPSLWFQSTDEHDVPRQRWHFDLWLAPEVVEDRVAAAVAAGGRVVYDAQAPSFVVLADADGNRVCVCSSLDR